MTETTPQGRGGETQGPYIRVGALSQYIIIRIKTPPWLCPGVHRGITMPCELESTHGVWVDGNRVSIETLLPNAPKSPAFVGTSHECAKRVMDFLLRKSLTGAKIYRPHPDEPIFYIG